jgi:hypothetical protein
LQANLIAGDWHRWKGEIVDWFFDGLWLFDGLGFVDWLLVILSLTPLDASSRLRRFRDGIGWNKFGELKPIAVGLWRCFPLTP